MAWIPFENRSAELKTSIQLKASALAADSSAQSFYDANELGLLDDSALLAWLEKDPVDQAFTTDQSNPTQQNSTSSQLYEEDLYVVKTLGWLMQNANTLEDKVIARKRYRSLLFDLWRKYQAQTGETWYPPLRKDLWDNYQFESGIITD